MQRKAVQFVEDVLDDPDKADELESLTPEEYADRKGIRIEANPKSPKERKPMASTKAPTKRELEDILDEVGTKVDEMLDAELTRKEIVVLAKELHELVNGPDDEDDMDAGEEDDDEEEDDEE